MWRLLNLVLPPANYGIFHLLTKLGSLHRFGLLTSTFSFNFLILIVIDEQFPAISLIFKSLYRDIFYRRLIKELDSSADVVVHIEWTVSRTTNVKDLSGITTSHHNVVLLPTDPTRRILADMLTVNGLSPSNSTIIIPYSFPKFLKVTSKTTDVVRQLMKLPSSQCKNYSR